MVREFNLINDLGQKYSLMDPKNYAFFEKPDGLGYSYTNTYQKIGNTYITSSSKLLQGSETGNLYFEKYENYRNLIDFIYGSTKLVLEYIIPYENSSKTFYRDIQITNISKSDKESNGYLVSSVTFTNLSLWYDKIIKQYIIEDDSSCTLWDFYFDSYFPSYSSRDLDYINDGHVDASIELNIDGEVNNTVIKLYVEGELYQEVKIKTLISQNEKLCYSSKENNFYIKKRQTNGTYVDLFDLNVIKFENDNVIRIPPKKQCRLTISADDVINSASLIVYSYYVSV